MSNLKNGMNDFNTKIGKDVLDKLELVEASLKALEAT
jgi:hypothetical protein